MMTATNPKHAFEECPRFSHCSINKCILHTDFKKLEDNPLDKEHVCTLEKTIRKKIGAKWNLKNKGLRDREINSAARWAAMPEAEKQVRMLKIKKAGILYRLSRSNSKRQGNIRTKQNQSCTGVQIDINRPLMRNQQVGSDHA